MSSPFAIVPGPGRGKAAVVRVKGRLDAKTAPLLVDQCMAVRSPGGHLVLTMSDVTFLSSSGVGAIMVLTERVKGDGGLLRLASPSSAVRAPLELLNLHRFLAIDESEDDAITALGA